MSPPNASGPPSAAPAGRDPRRPWAPSPFTRLARSHAASVSGDALFAIGLAGSVFFSLDFESARWRVALYLVLTIAPFAVAAPLIGPAIDRIRGGRRWIIVGSLAARALLCVLVVRHMESVLFYPEAFGMLVLQKVYSISKSAVVPGTVRSDEELVEANSKLTVLSAIAVVIAAAPGGLLLKLGGGGWSVALGALVYGVGTVLALQLPPTAVASQPPGEAEKEELRSAGIVAASSAMGLIRGIVGFLSFMLAFDIKENGALWELGLVAASAQIGFFFGAVMAPRIRKLATEEHILVGALLVTSAGGLATAVVGGLLGAAVLSMLVGATGSAAKQAFDAIVQRDAPDANRGRSFAKFEMRFQLVWVIGALVPILVPIPAAAGFAVIALVATFAVVTYLLSLRRIRRGEVPVRRRLRRPRPDAERGAAPTPAAPADTGLGVDLPPEPPPPPPPPPASRRPATPASAPPPPSPSPGPTTPAAGDPTVVGRPAAGPATAPRPTPAADDTLVVADRTVVAPAPGAATSPSSSSSSPSSPSPSPSPAPDPALPADPARRWMRPARAGRPASPPSATPTAADAPDGADGADGTDEVPHRRQGLLFDPEAWETPLPPDPDAAG